MQLRCVLLFRNILILVVQCGMDKTIYSNLISTKLLSKSKHIIVCGSQNPWTRPERQIKMNQLDVSLRTFLYSNRQRIVSKYMGIHAMSKFTFTVSYICKIILFITKRHRLH